MASEGTKTTDPADNADSSADSPAEETASTSPTEPTDDLVSTEHTITLPSGELRYTATTGRIVLRKEVLTDGASDGHVAKAEVFLTAYTLDGADVADRPVTFAFNGGPGSSSVWLHLGLLGPRRVLSGDVGNPVPPPYGLIDNPETLLAHSDIVFIDPISTGYSRAGKGEKPGDYHGYTADLESVGEIIRLWTSRNGRWMSPKFIAGESYGTLRAAGLAEHLQTRYGMYLNGLMLISSVLDLGTIDFTEGNDVPFVNFLPTYAAVAHYHGRHGDRPLADVLAEAEEFAERDYPWALARGHRLGDAERATAVAKLAALTGLSEEYIDQVEPAPRSTSGSSPSCCATNARWSAGSTRGSPAGKRTTRSSATARTRRTRQSSDRTRRRSTTTCARNWVTRTTCPTRSSPATCGPGRTRSSRALR